MRLTPRAETSVPAEVARAAAGEGARVARANAVVARRRLAAESRRRQADLGARQGWRPRRGRDSVAAVWLASSSALRTCTQTHRPFVSFPISPDDPDDQFDQLQHRRHQLERGVVQRSGVLFSDHAIWQLGDHRQQRRRAEHLLCRGRTRGAPYVARRPRPVGRLRHRQTPGLTGRAAAQHRRGVTHPLFGESTGRLPRCLWIATGGCFFGPAAQCVASRGPRTIEAPPNFDPVRVAGSSWSACDYRSFTSNGIVRYVR